MKSKSAGAVILCVALLVFAVTGHSKPLDPRTLDGNYMFVVTSDTDEDARVSVHFRRNSDPYGPTWLADGTMNDFIRKISIVFKGAEVSIEKNKVVVVDARFVSFKITGKRLEWLPGYTHHLEKEKE